MELFATFYFIIDIICQKNNDDNYYQIIEFPEVPSQNRPVFPQVKSHEGHKTRPQK